MRKSLATEKSSRDGQGAEDGFSLLEALLALGVMTVVVTAAMVMTTRYANGVRHLEIIEEIEELDMRVRAKLDCNRTLSSAQATCDLNSNVPIATYSSSCGILTAASPMGSTVSNAFFDVKATCGKDAGGYFLRPQFRRWADEARSKVAKDPLTSKSYDWQPLGNDLRCSAGDYAIGYPYYFPYFYNLVFSDSAINFAGRDPRMVANPATLTRMCQLLGYQHFRGILPTGGADSSPSDNFTMYAVDDSPPGSPRIHYQDGNFKMYQSSTVRNYRLSKYSAVCTNDSAAASSTACP